MASDSNEDSKAQGVVPLSPGTGSAPDPGETGRAVDSATADHDSPWKEALEVYFSEFLALLFPAVHAEIDWEQPPQFMDKELQQVARDADSGRRYADKLVKVFTLDGDETWILIHVEVQGEPERDFAARMFQYYYRLLDRYGVDVISLAVLADTSRQFRPHDYRRAHSGCGVEFRFPSVKLLDYLAPERWQMLEQSNNPFALVVMAQLRAKTVRSPGERAGWKFWLVRLLYDRGYGQADILELFRIIDWMVTLPPDLELSF
ncbi:MAG: hypothetical protein VBE63_29315, partial [Lamprobacter sp.]|uniref:hypothetical protein n=1 Tax=Lamprobacter sp. TaxID=3100796 RepID=UPI002B257C57